MSPLSAQCFSEANAGINLKDIKTSISSIPIHILEIEQKIVDSLHKMGVYDCGQLFKLPLSEQQVWWSIRALPQKINWNHSRSTDSYRE